MTFSVVKADSEVQISTAETLHDQPPAITILRDGGWVVTWTSRSGDGDGAIIQRRFDAQGQAVTSEIRVNVATAFTPDSTQVVALYDNPADPNDGGWIVVWQADHHIYQRRFNAQGQALDAIDVKVNTSAFSGHSNPSVSAIANGGWIVSWSSASKIFQRQYNAQGQATTNDIQVNTADIIGSDDVHVMALKDDPASPNDGGWIVTWTNSASGSIYQRRYDAQGQAVDSSDVQVASSGTSHSVTALADGGWVVVWKSFQGSGGIWQCRYDAQGHAVDSRPVLVSSQFANGHLSPAVSALADNPADPNDGGWIVTWTSLIGNEAILFQRRFDAQGRALDLAGVQVKVNPNNEVSAVAGLPDGSWVVTWTGASNGWNTYQRIYRPSDQNLLTGGTEFAMGTAGSEVLRVMPAVLDSTDELNGGAGSDTIKLEAAGALDLNAPKTFLGFEVVQGSSGGDSIIVGSWRISLI